MMPANLIIHVWKNKSKCRTYTRNKINYTWITDLNTKCKYIKLLGDNIGENLVNFGFGDDFLDTIPKAWSMKEKSWISLKLNFGSVKDKVMRMKHKPRLE